MKKIFLIFTILFVSVLSTACINNLAVQELNTKAKEYLDAGELDKAICRYKSSLDLDNTIFETNYNLGVALVSAKEYSEAIDVLKKAISINPSFADTYYSLAVAQEEKAFEMINKEQQPDEEDRQETSADEPEDISEASEPSEESKELSTEDMKKIADALNASIENYNSYLLKKPDAEDKAKIENHISTLNDELKKYSPDDVSMER